MTIKRLRVEIIGEPIFMRSDCPSGQNVRAAQDWLISAFSAAAHRYGFEPSETNLALLSQPPMSVQDFELQKRYRGGPWPLSTSLAKDAAAALFALTAGLPPDRKREDLSRAQRRKADGQAALFFSNDRVWAKGRPIETNIPLLLYLVFTIEGVINKRFPMSRPSTPLPGSLQGQTPPCGPAFDVLRAAYALASVKLSVMPPKAETVYASVDVARSDAFRRKLEACRNAYARLDGPGLSLRDFVATRPAEAALVFAEARGS